MTIVILELFIRKNIFYGWLPPIATSQNWKSKRNSIYRLCGKRKPKKINPHWLKYTRSLPWEGAGTSIEVQYRYWFRLPGHLTWWHNQTSKRGRYGKGVLKGLASLLGPLIQFIKKNQNFLDLVRPPRPTSYPTSSSQWNRSDCLRHIPLHRLSGTGLTAKFGANCPGSTSLIPEFFPPSFALWWHGRQSFPPALLRPCCTHASSV